MDILLYSIIVAVCILLSGFFSGSETALLRITKEKVNEDLESGGRLSVMAAKELLKNPSKLLVTILLGNNVVNILGAACASAIAVSIFGEEKGLIISTIAMTMVVLIFSEILPKSIAAKNPTKVGYFFALPLFLFHKTAYPFHIFYEKLIDPLVRKIAKSDNVKNEEKVSIAESIFKMAERIDTKKDGTALPIIGSAAAADSLTCEDIMISKSDIFAFNSKMSVEEAVIALAESRYTRALVYENSIDSISGFIHLKDLVRSSHMNNGASLIDLIKPIIMVPETMAILEVLPRMQKAFIHIAVVTNSEGETKGIVTQEDILEEIVGEIRDEFDSDELSRIKKINTKKYEVFGKVSIHDFNKETGWLISGAKGQSINEIIYTTLKRFPEKGDVVSIDRFEIKVLDISGKKATRLEVVLSDEIEI